MRDDFKKKIKMAVIFLVAIGIIGYGLFQSRNLISGPALTIFEPKNGSSPSHKFTEIRGRAENTSKITLNGRSILINPAGDFREKILLSEGYNVFTIVLEDRFGRTKTEKLEFVF